MKPLHKDGIYFKDELNRTRLLRGINLGGSSKVPTTPNGASHLREGFFEHQDVSFIGRPFPLDQADEHFMRLKHWGFDFIRLVTNWEAVEHAGIGIYDTAYLDYLEAIVDKAADYDFHLFIDFHQDVWSRFSGGDGAPGWTLEALGFQMENFTDTGAALVHQIHGDPFPKMHWATNYQKLAAATMFTVFFAGNDFAPETKIEGVNVQDFLQQAYFAMIKTVAKRMANKANVIGYDCMNEPSKGYIGYNNLEKLEWGLKLGYAPSPFEAMLLGDGIPQSLAYYILTYFGPLYFGQRKLDPQGKRAWQEGRDCIWKENGIWDKDSKGNPVLLRPDYFNYHNGEEVQFTEDYLRPFINKASEAIHAVDPEAMIFVEFDAIETGQIPLWTEANVENIVYAPHWYDYLTLMTKQYYRHLAVDQINMRLVAGNQAKRQAFAENLAFNKAVASTRFRNVPTLIGEVGIPYDMENRIGFKKNNWEAHILTWDDTMQALESSFLSYTLWNYTADNSNKHGDLWNGEDLSIYSPDQRTDPNNLDSGGRALEGFVRPFARKIAGEPLEMHFNLHSGEFYFRFCSDRAIEASSEFYIPNLQYPNGYTVEVSDGDYEILPEEQCLLYQVGNRGAEHWLRIKPKDKRHFYIHQHNGNIFTMITVLIAFILGYFYVRNSNLSTEEGMTARVEEE